MYRLPRMMNSRTIIFSHCKIADSIQTFHPRKFLYKTTKFCLTTRILPVHMCVYFFLYQLNLFVKEIVIFEPLSFFIWSHSHCFYLNLGICYNILLCHIYFVKQIHCINIIKSFSLKSDVIQKHKTMYHFWTMVSKKQWWIHETHLDLSTAGVSLEFDGGENTLDHLILCSL